MIRLFEDETSALTQYEKEELLPVMVRCLKRHIGKKAAISNAKICENLELHDYFTKETRVRKLINYIRNNNLVTCLIASGKGYYVSFDKDEIKVYIKSLEDRIEAITEVKDSLQAQLDDLINELPIEDNPDGQLPS